jgi:hypothetical protein
MEAVGIWQGAQGQGRMDSQVAGGQSPPSPTSEGRHAISMLEPRVVYVWPPHAHKNLVIWYYSIVYIYVLLCNGIKYAVSCSTGHEFESKIELI